MDRHKDSKKHYINMVKVRWSNDNEIKDKENTCPNKRLASDRLLERCLLCLTQNANESLHSTIWRHSSKNYFGSKRRVEMAVEQAICKYNAGTTVTVMKVQKAAGLSTGNKTVQLGKRRDRGRVVKAKLRATKKFLHYHQSIKLAKKKLLEAAKQREGISYKAGN
ncbi:hypothetical protein C0J52_16849 [Blattella germanica]|nr:hypothetical protein C0J52_16849 [Blattella germanica]